MYYSNIMRIAQVNSSRK